MQGLYDALVRIQRQLDSAGIPSAAIGGLALSVWGRARPTRDVDLKVLVGRDDAARLLAALPQEYQLLSASPLDTLQQVGFVFARAPGGIRMDLLLADMGFDEEALQRRVPVQVAPGASAWFCTAEDLVIYKLISMRARDHEDAENVVLRQGQHLNDDYVVGWLKEFESALDDSTLVAEYRRMRGLT